MSKISLNGEEVRAIDALVTRTKEQHISVDTAAFLKDISVIAHELPRRLRSFLDELKYSESPDGYCLVSGFSVNHEQLGLTPAHWKSRSGVSPTLREELFFVMCGTLLGDLIGWASQQNGYLLHDVLPIKEDEHSQISTGSQQDIWWHNEDAFHPYRGDYVALMCLRNPESVPTTLAVVDPTKISARQLKILFQPRFRILPDDSHNEENRARMSNVADGSDELIGLSYERIRQMHINPQNISVLYGDPRTPYIRIDPYFMKVHDDDEAQMALDALVRAIDDSIVELILLPGDCLYVDNYRAVHGRKSFKAKYDGTDRWLKRANITRDLRKSRDSRNHSASRIIF